MNQKTDSSDAVPRPRRPGTVEKGVLFGHDGWMFLASGGHHALDFILGLRSVRATSFDNFAANMAGRAAVADAAGATFHHVIFPDKQSVMPTESTVRNPICLGQKYLDRLNGGGERILYPRGMLQLQRGEMYRKTDTHATKEASLRVAALIATCLTGLTVEKTVPSALQLETRSEYVVGDLGSRFDPPFGEVCLFSRPTSTGKRAFNDIGTANTGIVDILCNPGAIFDQRLMIFGNSFGRDLCPALNDYFSTVMFLRTPFLHPEMVRRFRPDHIVTENAERYLSFVQPDSDADPFMDYPIFRRPDYRPSVDFDALLADVLGPL